MNFAPSFKDVQKWNCVHKDCVMSSVDAHFILMTDTFLQVWAQPISSLRNTFTTTHSNYSTKSSFYVFFLTVLLFLDPGCCKMILLKQYKQVPSPFSFFLRVDWMFSFSIASYLWEKLENVSKWQCKRERPCRQRTYQHLFVLNSAVWS